jgi:hypothetical protein
MPARAEGAHASEKGGLVNIARSNVGHVAWFAAVVTSTVGAGCSRPSAEAPPKESPAGELPLAVIKDVTVVPMTGGGEVPTSTSSCGAIVSSVSIRQYPLRTR